MIRVTAYLRLTHLGRPAAFLEPLADKDLTLPLLPVLLLKTLSVLLTKYKEDVNSLSSRVERLKGKKSSILYFNNTIDL